jgi:Fe-S oxidoreductase
VHTARPAAGERPLCCGRTFLAQGLVEEARREAKRLWAALAPHVRRGMPVVGLEPSCLFTLCDELPSLLSVEERNGLQPEALMWEQFLDVQAQQGKLRLDLHPLPQPRVLVHGHCHQKAFDAMRPVERVLGWIPGLEVQMVNSSCCGMAGSFGYEADHFEVSMRMGEASLLPAVRAAGKETLVVADGTSCRHQIQDGAGRTAWHVARVLEAAMKSELPGA